MTVTFNISLDSSIIISHLSGDIHEDDVLACVDRLASSRAEVFMSLVCYAEVWTGIELQANDNARRAAVELQRLIQASGIMLVADNVSIARDAARAQADYRRREVLIPDFLIGANAVHYSGRLLTTNPRDFLEIFLGSKCLGQKDS